MMEKSGFIVSTLTITIITYFAAVGLVNGDVTGSVEGVLNITGTLNGTPVVILNPNFDDAFLTVPQFISKYRYPVEVHNLTTADGYILSIHRIPYGLKSPAGNGTKPVVYLQHGLVSSSASWIINGPGKSLAFLLADEGYDVWMGNFRGNKYSRNHTSFDPNDKMGPFWDFSFHENAQYDIPTCINYMLNKTGVSSLIYVGHSMGTTSFFAAATIDATLNQKVKLFVALAPVVYMTYIKSPLRLLAPLVLTGLTQEVILTYGPGEFQPNDENQAKFRSYTCLTDLTADLVCNNLYFLIMGFDFPQMNNSQIPVYQSNYPQGSSLKTIAHYGQYMNQVTPNFCQFSYGSVQNLLKYGSLTPPCYDLTKVTVPTALYWGDNDWLADPTDIQILYQSNILPNVVVYKQVNWNGFNHADFIWAIDVKTLLYDDIIALAKNYP